MKDEELYLYLAIIASETADASLLCEQNPPGGKDKISTIGEVGFSSGNGIMKTGALLQGTHY